MTDPDILPARGTGNATTLTAAQRVGLVAAVVLVSGGVMAWNAVTGHVAVVPTFNGGLDPVAVARSGLATSALHWISIRSDGTRSSIDFASMLTNAAALSSVRYGVDQAVPDRALDLPASRHVWPLPPERFGPHVVLLPAASRFVSVAVTYADGTSSPVLIFPVPQHPK